MEPADNDIGEKARTIATVLGEHKKYEKFHFVGDSESISCLDNTQEWVAQINNLRIEYSTIENKEYSNKQTQIRAKWFWFLKKTIYYERNGQVTRNKLGIWKDEINNLYLKASRRAEWRENVAQLKNDMHLA